MESQQQRERERYVYELFVVYLCGWGERESKEEEPIGSQVDGGGGISHPDKIVGVCCTHSLATPRERDESPYHGQHYQTQREK
jgi:hypothetical protein